MSFPRKKVHPSPLLSLEEALAKLERFCLFRERAPKEVREKLAELGIDTEQAQQIYETLQADQFFNEQRFAEQFVLGKFRSNRWGRIRIRLELKHREIEPEIIEKALEQIPEEQYLQILSQLVEKKYNELQKQGTQHVREKTVAALTRAGFEMELIFHYL